MKPELRVLHACGRGLEEHFVGKLLHGFTNGFLQQRMAATGVVGAPTGFIHAVPHLCFVKGADDVAFLQARHAAMKDHHFFRGMQLTTDATVIQDWAPLVMEGRELSPVAATVGDGTEVNYGLLARRLCGWLALQEHFGVATG